MTAAAVARYRLRAQIRRWPSLAGPILVVAVATAVALGSSLGALRTSTAYDRFLRAARASDLLTSLETTGSTPAPYEALRSVPGVADLATLVGFAMVPTDAKSFTLAAGSSDGRYGVDIDRPNVLHGRLPDQHRADEVLVNRAFAATFHKGPGDRVELAALPADLNPNDLAAAVSASPHRRTVTITGIGAFTTDIITLTDIDRLPSVLVTQAMVQHVAAAWPESIAYDGAAIRLAPGADRTGVVEGLHRALAGLLVQDAASSSATVHRAIRPQTTALTIFAIVAALGGLLLVGQVVAQATATHDSDDTVLSALGASDRSLAASAVMRAILIGAIGVVIGAAAAIAVSPAFPIGPARAAEIHPGIDAPPGPLLGWAGVVVAFVAAVALVTAMTRRRRRASRRERTTRLAQAAARRGLPVPVVMGVRFATEPGQGRSAVPARTAFVSAAVALAAVAATATFASSLDALVTTPARFGQTWDVAYDGGFGLAEAGTAVRRFGSSPSVLGIAGLRYTELTVAGVVVPTIGFDELAGHASLTITSGRAPEGPDELAVGAKTLRTLHLHVGEMAAMSTEAGVRRLRVVGVVVLPQLGRGSFSTTGLGIGAVANLAALVPPDRLDAAQVPPGRSVDDFLAGDRIFNAVAFYLDPSHRQELLTAIRASTVATDSVEERLLQRPAAITNYAAVRSTPAILALVLAIVGVVAIAHSLVLVTLRRRRDLAVLKAIGLDGHGCSAVLWWQAVTVAAVSLLIGLPTGVIAGRLSWRLLATDLGVADRPIVPAGWLTVAVAGTFAVAGLAAWWPARRAGRLHPAAALRDE